MKHNGGDTARPWNANVCGTCYCWSKSIISVITYTMSGNNNLIN